MEIFADWLNKLNKSMKISNRNILLLIDNAGGHNVNSDLNLSNIKIVYLPPNTTSKLQPLDAGIITIFKCNYKST